MDKSYNFDKIVNIKFNNDSNKYNSFFIQPKINSGFENQNMIYLNNRKRNRENNYSNSSFKNKVNNSMLNNNNSFENNFLSFKDFSKKIKEELRFHKTKGKQLFNTNNIIQIFNDNKSKTKTRNNNNNTLLIENSLNFDNISINNNNNNQKNLLNSFNNTISPNKDINYTYNDNDNNNNSGNNNNDNYIYQTDKKLNINITNNITNDSYINPSQQKLLVTVSSSKKNKNPNDINTTNANNIDLNNYDNNIIINNIETIPIYKNSKKQVKQFCISLISGITIIGFVYFTGKESQKNEIKTALNFLSVTSWIKIFGFILIIIIIILLYYKNKEIAIFNKISIEDFEILKKLLYENYFGNKEEYIGLFQNQFIKDCSSKRNMTEGKYIKFILPLINKLIEKFNDKKSENENNIDNYNNNDNYNDVNDRWNNFYIDESDIIISGQKMKLWRYVKEYNI